MTSRDIPDSLIVKIEDLKSRLEDVRDEWQGEYDDLIENDQEGPVGEPLTEKIGYIEDAIEGLDNAIDNLRRT